MIAVRGADGGKRKMRTKGKSARKNWKEAMVAAQ